MTDQIVKSLHREITQICERTLGRPLADHERRFIQCRQGLIALEAILDFVKGMKSAELEHYLASERSTGPVPDEAGVRRRGHYLGTVLDGKWWKRCRQEGLFARGNGEWWLEGRGLYFRRYLTHEPIVIPLEGLIKVEIGHWHAGRWSGRRPILKLTWKREGRLLTAGFILSADPDETVVLADAFRSKR